MAPTATDYQWISEYRELVEGYCATLVRGITVQQFLQGLQAEPLGDLSGYEDLDQRTTELFTEFRRNRAVGRRYLIGATGVSGDQDEWVLGLERHGGLGVTDRLAAPLSRGTRLVSHFRNVNAVDRFHWYEDGEPRTRFEPIFATRREGSTPDELVEVMTEVGFDLPSGDEPDSSVHTAATFALAERLTGVRLTPDLLDKATFTAGLVPQNAVRKP
ncbi:DUF6461 domain-containing protein [Actinomadura rifamycini]|uniref:DUF6461 domain-containing protein n=1 Tax=Actinomadura rifamycini TaxID=31962 RepID=UPI00040CF635|nr:DUF6461 domain-containing protein [Actinomadura rifamycini]